MHQDTPVTFGTVTAYANTAWTESDDVLPADWSQERTYRRYLFGRTFGDMASTISPDNRSSRVTLQLFDRYDAQASLLGESKEPAATFPWLPASPEKHYALAIRSSATPLEDGFLTCLCFRGDTNEAHEQPNDMATVMRAFVLDEIAKYPRFGGMAGALRSLYEHLPEESVQCPAATAVDFPLFDCGHVDVGFGLLVHSGILPFGKGGVWLWSRVVHYPK